MATLKSGWLDKYSGTIFKSWKKRYCVLYKDGEFALYENPQQATADTRIILRTDCRQIKRGFACGSINLPKGQSSVDSLFCIQTRSGKEHFFAAGSDRECNEWIAFIEQARRSNVSQTHVIPQAPPQAPLAYQQNVQGGPPPPYTAGPTQPPGYPTAYPVQQVAYQPAPGYGQPMYVQQPMYGAQPGYGQPVYVQGAPQQQQSSNNSTRNMFLGAAAGGLGGYMLGSMVSNSMHNGWGHHDSFDHGGCGGGFDSGGGFDCGGGFDF